MFLLFNYDKFCIGKSLIDFRQYIWLLRGGSIYTSSNNAGMFYFNTNSNALGNANTNGTFRLVMRTMM